MTSEELEQEFRSCSVPYSGGLLVLSAGDALRLIERAEEEGFAVLGVDGIRCSAEGTSPSSEHSADYSSMVAAGKGCWADASSFIRERMHLDLGFEVVLT